MPFGLQPWHLLAIAAVALIIFGPRQLPEIGRGIGKAIREFRTGTKEMTQTFKEGIQETEPEKPVPAARPVAAEGQTGNFCTHCGSPNPAGARFCNKCGTEMPA